MSELINAYELLFYVKGTEPTSFDLRFIDTKRTDIEDRPWRMNVRVNPNDLSWNDEWEEVRIPLSSFTEMGSWDDNQWFNPQDDFDWTAVDVFQIVSEIGAMGSAELWFDFIRIVEKGKYEVSTWPVSDFVDYQLHQNYPNPFNPTTQIQYTLAVSAQVTLEVFNSLGQKVMELVNSQKSAGYHTEIFDATRLSSGVYFYKLTTPSFTDTKRMLLIK
jgi:endoglucanase